MPEASGYGVKLIDLPYRVVWDVHRKRASRFTVWCCNFDASKRLGAADPLILTRAAGDDMSAAIHFWLRRVEVSRIEG